MAENSQATVTEMLLSSNWIEIAEFVVQAILSTLRFWYGLYEFIYLKREYSQSTLFAEDKWAKVQVFSLSLIFKLWKLRHYRSRSFQQDMIDNLKNVAIPGTGVPLSVFCCNYYTCLFFILFLNPIVCLCGAVNKARKETANLEQLVALTSEYYIAHLLHPDDWFSLWRLNCRLVSLHSHVTQSDDYRQEDKWTFLTTGKDMGVPVTPYDDATDTLVCKNKNIEGGMGIHFYKNAAHGGEWILQEKLSNADWLNALLPPNAPLSTMRVITTSTWSLSEEYPLRKVLSLISSVSNGSGRGGEGGDYMEEEDDCGAVDLNSSHTSGHSNLSGGGSAATTKSRSGSGGQGSLDGTGSSLGSGRLAPDMGVGIMHVPSYDEAGSDRGASSRRPSSEGAVGAAVTAAAAAEELQTARKYVRCESGVLRLGRMGAETDHSSILFDVDISTGLIEGGTSNSQWYQLGLAKAQHCPWLPPFAGLERHPDGSRPQVKGQYIPDMQGAIDVVTSAHFKMMPDVPIVGWDVAFTAKGIFLLEVNLSCNFFRGSFDVPRYISLVDRYWLHLEKVAVLSRDCAEAEASQRSDGYKGGCGGGKKKYKRHSHTQAQQQQQMGQEGSAPL